MDDIRLLTKIATLYYQGGLTQQEIANRLGISRQTCGRHIHRAEELGIVSFEIQAPPEYSPQLEYQLEETFQLKEVIVVAPHADTEESVKGALGRAGASFLRRRVQENDVISVSWSSTVLQCAKFLTPTEPRHVTVVQMNGSLDRTSFLTRAEYTLEQIALAFGGTTVSLVAPMSVDTPAIKDSILSDSRIAGALELASQSEVAIFGVGNISKSSSLYKAGYLDDAMLEILNRVGAVGDICGRFFNIEGKNCVKEFDDRTIAIPLKNLKSKRVSLAIAAGLEKIDALCGMLAGKYCNALITDEVTAHALLKITNQ